MTAKQLILVAAIAVASFTIGGLAQTPARSSGTQPAAGQVGRYQLCSGRYPFSRKGAPTVMMEGLFRLDTQTGRLCELTVEIDENHNVNKTWVEIMPADGGVQSQR